MLIQHGTSRHDWAARTFSAHLSSLFDIPRIWTLDLDISRHSVLHRFREPLPPPLRPDRLADLRSLLQQPLAQLRPHHLQENLLLLLQQPCLVLLQMMTVLAQWSLIKDKATQSTTVPFQEI